MNTRPARSRRGIIIPVAIGIVMLLLATAVAASTVSSSGRRSVEVMRARRWARLAAASAFDEACRFIQASVDVPMITGPRDLKQVVKLPAKIAPALTQAEFLGQNVEVGELSVDTSPWTVQTSTPGANGLTSVREMGIIQLSCRITVRCGGFTLTRRVTVRRFALAVPRGRPEPGGGGSEMIYLSPFDLVHTEDEKEAA